MDFIPFEYLLFLILPLLSLVSASWRRQGSSSNICCGHLYLLGFGCDTHSGRANNAVEPG